MHYNREPRHIISLQKNDVASFMDENTSSHNLDPNTVRQFSDEWTKFDHFTEQELSVIGNQYFDIVTEKMLNGSSVVLDVGCGMGRWSRFLANRVEFIEAVDPSAAVVPAATFNADKKNIRITQAGIENLPFDDESFDFAFCLGVLDHVPDPQQGILEIVKKIKTKGHFLIYMYYNFENRGPLFKALFKMSHFIRLCTSKLPGKLKLPLCDLIAVTIYVPFVLLAKLVKRLFPNKLYYKKIPLSYYVDKNFQIMRNDALDRFGSPLEKRHTKEEIKTMLENAGLSHIIFSENEPYWHAVGQKNLNSQVSKLSADKYYTCLGRSFVLLQ